MAQDKSEASVAQMMTTIHNGIEYTMETTPDGEIRIATSSAYCTLSADAAKDVLNPMSDRRPKRPLQSMVIDTFERDLRGLVRELDTETATKTPA